MRRDLKGSQSQGHGRENILPLGTLGEKPIALQVEVEVSKLLRTNLQTDPKAQTEGAPRTGNPLLLALSTQIVRDIVFSLRGLPGFFGERWEGPCHADADLFERFSVLAEAEAAVSSIPTPRHKHAPKVSTTFLQPPDFLNLGFGTS